VKLVGHRGTEQLVPGRVELDLVDAVAETVVGAELRGVLVRQSSKLDGAPGPGELADGRYAVRGPVRALARDGLDQCPVGLEDVVVGQRGRLVQHLVGACPGSALDGGHPVILAATGAADPRRCRGNG
jgi:hypothetical protein